MSGKPAARQGDMTQYGGPIVQWFGRCKNWRANWRGVLGVSGRDDFGQPGKSAAGGEGAARRDGPCAARPAAVHSLPAPTAATGRRRLHRWGFLAPAGKRLLISAYRYAMMHWYSTTTADGAFTLSRCCRVRRCTAAASPLWLVRGGKATQPDGHTLARLWASLPPDIRLSPHLYLATNSAQGAVVDTGVVRAGAGC